MKYHSASAHIFHLASWLMAFVDAVTTGHAAFAAMDEKSSDVTAQSDMVHGLLWYCSLISFYDMGLQIVRPDR